MLKIGVFDSGLGGLTVVKAMTQVIQNAKIIYIADTLHAPYGEKTPQEILNYSLNIAQYLIQEHEIDALVVACNTATSAAIIALRERYPTLIIIGTEPAIKPAITSSKTGKVGVLATPATLKGDKYQTLVDTLSKTKDIRLYEQACAGLVEHIENDTLQSKASMDRLHAWLTPMSEAGVDTIVLGCTHYPLAAEVISAHMSSDVTLIDSGKAIAQHLHIKLKKFHHHNEGTLEICLLYTGDINQNLVHKILPDVKKLRYIEIK